MKILFSLAHNQNIERIYHSLDAKEVQSKKSFLLNKLEEIIKVKIQEMGLIEVFDEICIDVKPKSFACCRVEKENKRMVLFLNSVENERELNYNILHQLGHAQDVVSGRVNIEQFEKLAQKNARGAYFVWDILLDSRLCREKRLTFFQARSLYYDYKIRMRTLFNSEVEGFFEELWEIKDYSALSIETALARCK